MHVKFRLLVLLIFISWGCKHEPAHSFYYWKSVFYVSENEVYYLEKLNISKLYLRFFDVGIDNATEKVVPIAAINFKSKIPQNCEVIPVVYIVNQSLKNTNLTDIPNLAAKIVKKVNAIAVSNQIVFHEFQLDCDWTESTRDKYFELIRTLKSNLGGEKTLSATIRLHQIKYKEITGLPPVDRGMLMYYNMGKITADLSRNSVFNATDAARYIDHLPDYPLPLDVALPAFSWGIHIRNNIVVGLLNNIDFSAFNNTSYFKRVDASSFMANHSFFFLGFYFMENDVVKVESVSPEQCSIAAQQLKSKLDKPTGTVAIFHLDSLILTRYEKEDFEKVFYTYR